MFWVCSLKLLAGTDTTMVLQPSPLLGPGERQVETPPLGSMDDHTKLIADLLASRAINHE